MRLAFACLLALLLSLATACAQEAGYSFKVVDDWGSGFQGEIKIQNTGSTPINDWTLEFDLTPSITSVWDATLLSSSAGHYKVKNAGWNGTIAPGASVAFGFVATPGGFTGSPSNYVLGSGGSGGGGGGGGTATGAPAKPSLSILRNPDGTATANWNLWSGNNATRWDLKEDGVRIYRAYLSDGTPGSQTGSFVIRDRGYSAHAYEVVLANSFGTNKSDKVTFTFGGASKIVVAPLDGVEQATQATIPLAGDTSFTLSVLGQSKTAFSVISNGSPNCEFALTGKTLTLKPRASGRASIRIRETITGETRYLGIRVLTADGKVPALPAGAIGSVSEDSDEDLGFWRDFGDPFKGRRMDVRYIYLNGGPANGWRTWTPVDGGRIITYIRESQKLGIVPYFVWYNIPDGGESYFVDRQHIEDAAYLRDYFRDLRFACELINRLAPDDPVGLVLEPDFIGYMMQNSGVRPADILARTNAAYDSGVLTRNVDPKFAGTLPGLVKAINYTISKYAPSARFGWQFNLWASPGIHHGIPSTGLMHLTDTMGIAQGRAAIRAEAIEIVRYYKEAGILSYGASFVSIDKYGLDAGAENGAAANPQNSTWFWNSDHWNNYLGFVSTLHEKTALPVVLWQLPCGRINGSTAISPYTGARFVDLNNTARHYEDSAPSFFLGDTFELSGNRLAHFSKNQSNDPRITVSGNQVTWRPHIDAALAAGVSTLLFGAGVGDSTDGLGGPPSDNWWWIHKVQEILRGR